MKNTLGSSVTITLFGESHGQAIGAVIDGLAPGIDVDNEFIKKQLARRRPNAKTDTARQEMDNYQIVSGVFEGKTTGTPICILIPNEDTKSKDYSQIKDIARPSHADYAAECKYHGYQDYRGGGHFSGRVTSALVGAGAIAISALKKLGIKIGTHILRCGNVYDIEFSNYENEIDALENKDFPVISNVQEQMINEILKAKEALDSIGGVIQTAIYGMPSGVGEPYFDSIESIISHAVFSIGGIKGIEFGKGFGFADMLGSQANDEFEVKDGKIVTKTNNNAGINGGITNSMPIVFNCAVKPTPSIAKEQNTVNFKENENTTVVVKGRHDPAIIRRICVVVDSICALTICDVLAQRYGTDVFTKGIK